MPDIIVQSVSEEIQRKLHDAGFSHLKTGLRGKI